MPFSVAIRLLSVVGIMLLAACHQTPVDPNSTTTPALPTGLLYPKTIHFVKATTGNSGLDLTHYFDYNAPKKISKITVLESADTNRLVKIVNFSYDAAGQLSRITTYGSPYFFIGYYQKTKPTQFVTHLVTHSSQGVDVLLADSIPLRREHYSIKYDQNGNLVQFHNYFDGNYIYDLTPAKNGNVSDYVYTFLNVNGKENTTISRSAELNMKLYYMDNVIHPFANTPELRLYSLLRDEADYGYYEEDLLLQNYYCLSEVTNGGFLGDTRFTHTTTPYSSTSYAFVVNEKGYATTIKSKAASTLVRAIDITYTAL